MNPWVIFDPQHLPDEERLCWLAVLLDVKDRVLYFLQMGTGMMDGGEWCWIVGDGEDAAGRVTHWVYVEEPATPNGTPWNEWYKPELPATDSPVPISTFL